MKILSFNEASKRLGYHPQHIRRLVKQGKLKPPFRLVRDGRPLYTEEYIDGLIKTRSGENGAELEGAA
jgi:Helix-turn-helix domain